MLGKEVHIHRATNYGLDYIGHGMPTFDEMEFVRSKWILSPSRTTAIHGRNYSHAWYELGYLSCLCYPGLNITGPNWDTELWFQLTIGSIDGPTIYQDKDKFLLSREDKAGYALQVLDIFLIEYPIYFFCL